MNRGNIFQNAIRVSVSFAAILGLIVGMAGQSWAKPFKAPTQQAIPAFPGTLVNAKYVYVTSYDGDQFNRNLLPEDREAIATVQDEIQKWGKFVLVYEPHQADVILRVTGRPSEDILAVYDARGPQDQYLWRMMSRGGLQKGEAPLLTDLEKAFVEATGK